MIRYSGRGSFKYDHEIAFGFDFRTANFRTQKQSNAKDWKLLSLHPQSQTSSVLHLESIVPGGTKTGVIRQSWAITDMILAQPAEDISNTMVRGS
jgi:hypothetical protein